MRKIDVNRNYRNCAIYCATRGRMNNGKGHITWEELEKQFGINWETRTNELRVKGMLFGSNGYMYLQPAWAAMTAREQIEEIKKMYPYPYETNNI